MVTAANWQDLWSSFDPRRDARASEGANDLDDAIEAATYESDMFGSVAAE